MHTLTWPIEFPPPNQLPHAYHKVSPESFFFLGGRGDEGLRVWNFLQHFDAFFVSGPTRVFGQGVFGLKVLRALDTVMLRHTDLFNIDRLVCQRFSFFGIGQGGVNLVHVHLNPATQVSQ